ncbi:MAG: protein-glutamate O-methyltransferase CheR [Thermoanaerobaculales bacterium]|nr:protein-glutamate O-methyltransferase CheR [Thermoanaerobaculales bacterium]
MERIIDTVRRASGLDLSGYCSELVRQKVTERRQALGLGGLGEYLAALENDPAECGRLTEVVGVNYSVFFRDPPVFETLAHRVIPQILDSARLEKREIRVWSAGCAAGEEAYSVAILLVEALAEDLKQSRVFIFGTDIDDSALERAERGVWLRGALEFTRLGLVDKYFEGDGETFRIRAALREMVRFSRDDLMSPRTLAPPDSIFGAFDLVLCRNVLIYLKTEVKAIVCAKILRSLRPGGFLVLGETEDIDEGTRLRLVPVDHACRIFRRPG